jgi:hypothetical protein
MRFAPPVCGSGGRSSLSGASDPFGVSGSSGQSGAFPEDRRTQKSGNQDQYL